MKLSNLVDGYEIIEMMGDMSSEIVSIEYDSRKVKKGSLFVAVQGFTYNGNSYIGDVVRKGAAGIVTDIPDTRADVATIIVVDARKAMAVIADRFFGSPQNSLVMAAVTGTNGKTTVSYMVKSIFEASGIRCGIIGTIGHVIGGDTIESLNTTPESVDIHSMLSKINEASQHACVMEVSSHALALSRVHGIQFRAAAFTNISRDHLDFHGDFKEYLEAKSILFTTLSGDSTAVVNLDDSHADYIINVSRGSKIITFGFNNRCEIHPVSYELGTRGSDIVLSTPAGQMKLQLPIPGKFNISNAMAAVGLGLACGLQIDEIVNGLESMKPVRGRYENIDEGQDFSVIIDYAHTPDALENILSSVREITKGRLISVFGCGGDRDRGKRPEMGAISTRLADYSIITSDNPRTENPEDIIDDIIKGAMEKAEYIAIPDRESGISEAVNMVQAGDSIVIAGKGHEDYQIIGTEKRHFDDAEIVRRLIRAKHGRL
ncbi:UDP-N-acetylmuramoyl-L-alanyl-D-glutamate--2,6-diaminopimelate ligase [Candidatus Latescibacterota bacterium]